MALLEIKNITKLFDENTILKNVSDTEAVMNKNALEFVGAKLEVK